MHATLTDRYEVAIPESIRDPLRLQPRQEMTILEKDGAVVLIPQRPLDELRGIPTAGYRDKTDRYSRAFCR